MFGYAKLYWDVGLLADGKYEIRVSTECDPAGIDPPDGINNVFSSVIAGVVDTVPPKVFDNAPEPADGTLSAGDEIRVDFTEELLCTAPYVFSVQVTVGSSLVYSKDSLDIVCEGRSIIISLANLLSLDSLSGVDVSVTVSGVKDLALNELEEDATWTFTGDASSSTSLVEVTDLVLNVAWDDSWDDTSSAEYIAFAESLASAAASLLDVDATQIIITELSSYEVTKNGKTKYKTLVSLVYLPEEDVVARRRRAIGLPKNTGGLNPSLLLPLLNQTVLNVGVDGLPSFEDGLRTAVRNAPTVKTSAAASGSAGIASSSGDEDTQTTLMVVVLLFVVVQTAVLVYWCKRSRSEVNVKEIVQALKRELGNDSSFDSTIGGRQSNRYKLATIGSVAETNMGPSADSLNPPGHDYDYASPLTSSPSNAFQAEGVFYTSVTEHDC
jgi:hypothetical protein